MLKRTMAIAVAFTMLGLFAGCSSTGNFREETLLDKNWGRSVETAKHNQIFDPDAGKNLTPVEGLSGESAGYSIEKYENSFRNETKQETTTTTATMK